MCNIKKLNTERNSSENNSSIWDETGSNKNVPTN